MLKVILQKGKEKPILMGHPWVFSGAIQRIEGAGQAGEPCEVFTISGEKIGSGYYNDNSTIRVRMLCRAGETFDLDARIESAVSLRKSILTQDTNSCRLINSEGDRLPGLVVDKYADGLCVQIQTAGMERLRAQIVAALKRCCLPSFIVERSDTDARMREGLVASDGVLDGVVPATVVVRENGLDFCANVSAGQKTGFFLDQRDNRKLFSHYAIDKNICDCFCYSAGFSIYGLAAGAKHTTAVDISKNAIDNAKTNIALHKFNPAQYDCVVADVFEYLRKPDKKFDCIVLDPPKFAKHKGEVDKAARGYKDINLLACRSIDKGGIIFTFSCSQAIDTILFRQIVFAAAADSNRHVQVLHTLGAGPDHPFSIAHREGEYLKGLVLRVL